MSLTIFLSFSLSLSLYIYIYIYISTWSKHTHTHTHIYIYIYIYIYTNFIKHNRHFIRIPVLLLSYSVGGLIYVLSIVVCIPSK